MTFKPSASSSLTRVVDKTGVLGTLVTAMSCPAWFPALASLGAAIGLGFLSPYEGLFIRVLLPVFAGIALLANGWGALRHRRWPRAALSLLGPLLFSPRHSSCVPRATVPVGCSIRGLR